MSAMETNETREAYISKSLPTSSLLMSPDKMMSGAAWRSTMRRLRSRFVYGPVPEKKKRKKSNVNC